MSKAAVAAVSAAATAPTPWLYAAGLDDLESPLCQLSSEILCSKDKAAAVKPVTLPVAFAKPSTSLFESVKNSEIADTMFNPVRTTRTERKGAFSKASLRLYGLPLKYWPAFADVIRITGTFRASTSGGLRVAAALPLFFAASLSH